jgi:hypothetical protein
MNKKQKRLLILTLVVFWISVIYIPECDNIKVVCDAFYGYDFIWQSATGVYIPFLVIAWIALLVNFVALYFYLNDE